MSCCIHNVNETGVSEMATAQQVHQQLADKFSFRLEKTRKSA
jgi:hypothetical protein